MLNSRHGARWDGEVLVRAWPARHHPRTRIDYLYADWAQLVYAAEGTISVETPSGTWVVPPHRAVWVPAGVEHSVESHGWATLRSLYYRKEIAPTNLGGTIGLTPLARELILHIAAIAPLWRGVSSQRRLAFVLLDHLRQLPVLPVYLPQPRTEPSITAARTLIEGTLSPEAVAKELGLSLRTMERVFKSETGLSVGTWRQQARLLEALRLLAQGIPVGEISFRVGYGSDSAFIFAFRQAFGVSPGRFYNQTAE